jgi:outer membrane protein OmpA-like peptidoglycan-associated protein
LIRGLAAVAAALVVPTVAGCSEAEQFVEEHAGTLDLSEIDLSEVTIPDLNDPDFTLPDIVSPDLVAPEIDIDFDDLIVEAPDIPVIRFPDAVIIQVQQITNPAVTVAETADETIYTIEGQVMFDFDRADLRPEAVGILEEIEAAIAARDFRGTIEVAGHTDAIGTPEYNQGLSERRAAGVALWFRQRVSAEQAIVAVGYGESQPIAPNTLPDGSDDPVGRAQNRRVEIIVYR